MTLQKYKKPVFALFGALLAAPIVTACTADNGQFPSLAKRPYENDDPLAIPEEKPVAVATSLPSTIAGQVVALERRHKAAQAAFDKALPNTSATVTRARGAAVGGEAWANANVQLSRLDYARSDSVKVVGEMDAIVAAQREADSNSDAPIVTPLLEARQKAIADDVERQTAEINRLAALLD